MVANRGNVLAQFLMGNIFFDGLGVPKDYELGLVWYRKAANQEYPVAQYKIGMAYEYGYGVMQNYAKAFYWYRLAAINGVRDAAIRLATFYAGGRGTEQDLRLAYLWCHRAWGLTLPGRTDHCSEYKSKLDPLDAWKARWDAGECAKSNFDAC